MSRDQYGLQRSEFAPKPGPQGPPKRGHGPAIVTWTDDNGNTVRGARQGDAVAPDRMEGEPGIKSYRWEAPSAWGEPEKVISFPASRVLGLPYRKLRFRWANNAEVLQFTKPVPGLD